MSESSIVKKHDSNPHLKKHTEKADDMEEFLLEGYLSKKSSNGWWQKRWFETSNQFLTYRSKRGGEVRASIDLKSIKEVRLSKQSKTKRKFVLVASDDQNEIVLKAEDEAEARHWIEMLNKRLEFLPKHLELSKQRGGRGRRKEAWMNVRRGAKGRFEKIWCFVERKTLHCYRKKSKVHSKQIGRGTLIVSLNLSSSDVSNSTKEEDEDVEDRSPLERTQPVAGTLRVRVMEARNLRSADAGGTSDPYVKMYLKSNGVKCSNVCKTEVIHKTLNPKWGNDEVHEFRSINDVNYTSLVFQVYDHDKVSAHDFLGQVELPLHISMTSDDEISLSLSSLFDGQAFEVPIVNSGAYERQDLVHEIDRPNCFELWPRDHRSTVTFQAMSKDDMKDWLEVMKMNGAIMLDGAPSALSDPSGGRKGTLSVRIKRDLESEPFQTCWAVLREGILSAYSEKGEEYKKPKVSGRVNVTAMVLPPDGGFGGSNVVPHGAATIVVTLHTLKNITGGVKKNRRIYCELVLVEGTSVSRVQRSAALPVMTTVSKKTNEEDEQEDEKKSEEDQNGYGYVDWSSHNAVFSYEASKVESAYVSILVWDTNCLLGRRFLGHCEIKISDQITTNKVTRRAEYSLLAASADEVSKTSGLPLSGLALLKCDAEQKNDARGIEIHGSGKGTLLLFSTRSRLEREKWVKSLVTAGCKLYADEVAKAIPDDLRRDLTSMKHDDERLQMKGVLECYMGDRGSTIGLDRWRERYCKLENGVLYTFVTDKSQGYRTAIHLKDMTWIRWSSDFDRGRVLELLPSVLRGEGKKGLLLRASSSKIAVKWLNALRLAHVAVRAGIFAKKKDDIIMDEEEVKSWLEHFDSSTSPERLEAVFASFKKLNEAESVEDVVRYASELLGDLYDIATECKRLDRLDVLKFYTKYYHLQLISTTEQHVHNPEILTSADLLKLIRFMGDYESTLCGVLENSKHNVLGSLNIDAYEMEGDYHNLIERYVKITRPKIEEFFERICNNMLQSQLSSAVSKSLDGVSLFNENEFGQMYTLAPVDMLNVTHEYLKVASKTNVSSLQASILKVCLKCLENYQNRITAVLQLTGTNMKQMFAFAIVNDCFSVMEELDSLRSEYEHIVNEHAVEFRQVTQAFVRGGLVAINNVALQMVEASRESLNRSVALLAYEDDQESSASPSSDDKDENRGQRHRKMMNQVLGTLRRDLKRLQDSLCDYFFRKFVVALAREIVIVYCRALYVPCMSVFSPFHISPSDVSQFREDKKQLVGVFGQYVSVESRFFRKRILPSFEPLDVIIEFISTKPDHVGAVYDEVMRKHAYGSVSVCLAFRMALMMRLDCPKHLRHSLLQAARESAVKTVKVLGTSEETQKRRSADVFYRIFPVGARELLHSKALAQMPHFHFLEQKDKSLTHEEAMRKVQESNMTSETGEEKKEGGGGINVTCTTMEDFLN